MFVCGLFRTGPIFQGFRSSSASSLLPHFHLWNTFSTHTLLTHRKSLQKHDERTELPKANTSCTNGDLVASSHNIMVKFGARRGFLLLLRLVGFRLCSFLAVFCSMNTAACLYLTGDYIEFFPAMSGKWLIGFLAIILALEVLLYFLSLLRKLRKFYGFCQVK